MLINILLGLSIMLLCLLLQILLLLAAIRYYKRREHLVCNPAFDASLSVVSGLMRLLVLGNLGQIAIWAGLFVHLGEFDRFTDAFYHSAVNFATLGYGDVVMSPHHRLLGPLESLNGIVMIGISTSAFTAVLQRIMRNARVAQRRPGAKRRLP